MSNVENNPESTTYFPLHPAQEGVYFDQLLQPESAVYSFGVYSVSEQAFDLNILQSTWRLHPTLT